MEFNRINWRSAQKWLEIKQIKLIKAYQKNNIELVKRIQISILKNFRTTAIAVQKVYTNDGSSTPGIDGKVMKTKKDREEFTKAVHKIMRNPSTSKPSPVKQIQIPKGNGNLKPLGTPTIQDRIAQAVYL